MLAATLLALGAAVLHAGWNLAVKQTDGDRFIALWGQFTLVGVLCAVAIVLAGGLSTEGWKWAIVSGCVHLPYCWFLAAAYDQGDFSLVYPVARGGGALLAAIGGLVLLGDDLSPLSVFAIVVVATGLFLLAGHARGPAIMSAAIVAVTIGAYSVSDAKGIRVSSNAYVFATFVTTAVTTSTFGLVTGRRPEMVAAVRVHWRRFLAIGTVSAITYGMVQLAFRRAPVGYVTALRESSVVIAAIVGAKMLHEPAGKRRIASSVVVLAGLVLLVVSG